MKALTIKQPWASAIMAGVKRVENRTWSTNHRGPLVIHAAQRIDPDGAQLLAAAGIDAQQFADAPRGAILGTVDLVDVVAVQHPACADDPLACGPWCWILENPQPLAEPVACPGQLSLWNYDLNGGE